MMMASSAPSHRVWTRPTPPVVTAIVTALGRSCMASISSSTSMMALRERGRDEDEREKGRENTCCSAHRSTDHGYLRSVPSASMSKQQGPRHMRSILDRGDDRIDLDGTIAERRASKGRWATDVAANDRIVIVD